MSARRVTPLQTLAKMAAVLDNDEFTRAISPAQWDAFGEAASILRKELTSDGGVLTAPQLHAVVVGAGMNASLERSSPTDAIGQMMRQVGVADAVAATRSDPAPHFALSIAVALLARDLLEGAAS